MAVPHDHRRDGRPAPARVDGGDGSFYIQRAPGKLVQGAPMTRKSSILAVFVALGAAVSLSAGAPADRRAGARTLEASEDGVSISAFVADLRSELESSPARAIAPSRSFQEAVSRILPESSDLPRCLTPIVLEVSRQAAASPELSSF